MKRRPKVHLSGLGLRGLSTSATAAALLLAAAVLATVNAADSTEPGLQVDRLGGTRGARAEAREALAAIGSRAVPALVDRIEDPRFSVRWEVVNLLGRIRDPIAVSPLLARVVEDENPHVRWRAIWALRAIGDDSVADRLAARMGEGDPVRWNVSVALSMFDDSRSLALLTEKISSRDPWVRWEAVNALGRVHDDRSSAALLELLDHSHLRTRQEAVMSLGRIGDETAVMGLIRGLEDPSPQVRWRAAMGLGRIREADVRPALTARLEVELNPRVRTHLRSALGNLAR